MKILSHHVFSNIQSNGWPRWWSPSSKVCPLPIPHIPVCPLTLCLSHTKSRKGCESCKKRHIRCDESFPQCRNCTKHKTRCPYNDIPVQEARPNGPPDLLWTPEVQATLDQWRRTCVFPFPGLDVNPIPSPQLYSYQELRLIYHVASISHQLGALEANGFTLWTSKIPT